MDSQSIRSATHCYLLAVVELTFSLCFCLRKSSRSLALDVCCSVYFWVFGASKSEPPRYDLCFIAARANTAWFNIAVWFMPGVTCIMDCRCFRRMPVTTSRVLGRTTLSRDDLNSFSTLSKSGPIVSIQWAALLNGSTLVDSLDKWDNIESSIIRYTWEWMV